MGQRQAWLDVRAARRCASGAAFDDATTAKVGDAKVVAGMSRFEMHPWFTLREWHDHLAIWHARQ